jgi:D-cysteine desulfhydrase
LELARLRAALGEGCPRVFIKRDDLTGLALGGNKSRKLEYLLADAVSKSATSVITCGAAQSNHALQTAAACKIFGFDVRCILYGRPPDEGAGRSGNLLLHELLDTPIRWVTMRVGETRREQALRRGMAEEAAKVEAEGGRVYWIPTGGSTAVGALGYARAVIELRTQIPEAEIDKIKAIYFASGSGGTHTGLVVGKWLANWDVRCVGAEVEPIQAGSDGVSPFRRAIQNLTRETASLLGIDRPVMPDDIELDGSCTGRAYGVETEEGREAARLLFRTEGILLDPVYTAKTFASMVAAIRRGDFSADQIVLFWHTGGAAGLFAAH